MDENGRDNGASSPAMTGWEVSMRAGGVAGKRRTYLEATKKGQGERGSQCAMSNPGHSENNGTGGKKRPRQ